MLVKLRIGGRGIELAHTHMDCDVFEPRRNYRLSVKTITNQQLISNAILLYSHWSNRASNFIYVGCLMFTVKSRSRAGHVTVKCTQTLSPPH